MKITIFHPKNIRDMNKEERIQRINRVLKGYFSDSSNPRSIPAKELMDLFCLKRNF